MNNMRTENWCGYEIRLVEIDGEWWAILKDICDALDLRTDSVAQRLEPSRLKRVPVQTSYSRTRPNTYRSKISDHTLTGVGKNQANRVPNAIVHMLAVDELGIYKALFASRRLEARQFTDWVAETVRRLRKHAGLRGYEVMRMTNPDVEEYLDREMDELFWDDERNCYVRSTADHYGDVDVEFYDYYGRRIDYFD